MTTNEDLLAEVRQELKSITESLGDPLFKTSVSDLAEEVELLREEIHCERQRTDAVAFGVRTLLGFAAAAIFSLGITEVRTNTVHGCIEIFVGVVFFLVGVYVSHVAKDHRYMRSL